MPPAWPRWPALSLAAAFLFAGLIGHDPWKPDEGYVFGVVLHILESGDWVVPTLAGEPFMEKPPLYYLVAAATANVLSPVLPLHDGARVASAVFVAIAMICVGATARKLFGPRAGEGAALLLIACLGLLQHAHQMIPDTALVAGFAIAFLGLAHALDRPRLAGFLLGTGVGVGLMSKGMLAPAVFFLTCVALVLFRAWRTRAYASSLGWALLWSLPWLLAWPMALYATDPSLFLEWFWTNNLGRYLGFARLGGDSQPWYYTTTLPWFAFPAWPLALVALIAARTRIESRTGAILCAALFAVLGLALGSASSARQLYALPLLVPIAVAASAALPIVGERIPSALTAAFAGLALLIALAIWAVWVYAMAQGHPPPIELLLRWFPRDFAFGFDARFFLAAAAITVLWAVIWFWRPAGTSWIHRWVASLALVWGLAMTLLLPWIDEAKSFREPFAEMARYLPSSECVSSTGLGEPQRAMLHYYLGVKTLRTETTGQSCSWHVVQTEDGARPGLPGDWRLLWEGARNGETRERFSLYAKPPFHRASETLERGAAIGRYRARERTSAIQGAGSTTLRPAP